MPSWWLVVVGIAVVMRTLAWFVTWAVFWAAVVAIAFGVILTTGTAGAVAVPWMASTVGILVAISPSPLRS